MCDRCATSAFIFDEFAATIRSVERKLDTNISAESAHCFSRSVFKDGDAPFGRSCKRAELSLDATKHTVHGAWFTKDLVGAVGLMRSQANAYPSFASSVGRKPKNAPLA